MTTKWSKGPWLVDDQGGDKHLRSADGESLMCDTNYYPWVPANDADWVLIASAPALYEALDGILAITDRNHVAWEKARAALRQARGEQ